MADENFCLVELNGLTPGEQKEVQKAMKDIVNKARKNADIENMQDAVEDALKKYEESLKIGQMIQKRNAYLNKQARNNIVDYIQTNWSDDPGEGLKAFLAGTQVESKGGRDSVAAAYNAYRNKYRNAFMARVIKGNYKKIMSEGTLDIEVAKATDAIDNGKPLTGLSKEAIEIANIYKDINNLMKADANRHGAAIRDMPGYLFKRGHNSAKIKADMEGWMSWMMKNVNWDKNIAADDAARMDVLKKEVMQFASGAHIVERFGDDETSGLKGFSSIAKRMSKSRVFEFNTPEAEIEYAKKFGYGSMYENMISNIEQRGRQIGIMSRLGPNAEMNLDNAVDDILKSYNKSGDISKYKQMENLKAAKQMVDDSLMPTITGRTQIPGAGISEILSNVEATILGGQRWSLLGGSGILSGVIDPFVKSFSAWRRSGEIADAFDEYAQSFKTMFDNLSDPEVQDLLADLGVTNDYMLASINTRYGLDEVAATSYQQKLRNIDNTFFYLNGQYFFDTRNRAAGTIGMATRLGNQTSKSFKDLSPKYQELFKKHSITPEAWDVIRKSTTDFRGQKVLHAEGINKIDIDKYLESQGKKLTDYQRKKAQEDLRIKVMQMFNDEISYGVLGADDRLRAMMFGGNKSGTTTGALRKLFWQFKQFPMSFFQKIVGRELYSNAPMMEKIGNLSAALAATTIGGYIALNIDQLRRGREPVEFSAETIGRSIIRGGGLGIYGDFLYNLTMNRFGQSATTTFLGPTVGDVDTFSKVLSGLLQGDMNKAGDNAVRLVTTNLPFANIAYIKPVLDWLVLNQLAEAISPGVNVRAERRLEKEYNQRYIFGKPSETMLFKP